MYVHRRSESISENNDTITEMAIRTYSARSYFPDSLSHTRSAVMSTMETTDAYVSGP